MAVSADSFCIGPWSELRIDSDGLYNFCHAAIKSTDTGDAIQHLEPMEYFRNTADTVRQQLMQGQSVSQCQHCYRSESAGLISFRQRRNLQAGIFPGDDFQQSYKESRFVQNLTTDINPRFYHVSLSNLCNLGCIMCHPRNSSYLTADLKRIQLVDQTRPTLTDWTTGPAWEHFCQHLLDNPDIVSFHVMGGEPLYHKKFHELLDRLIAAEHTDFVFTFVSNGTIYDPVAVAKLKNFRSVQMEISIEGVTATNDYIRWPSQTTEILDNIQQYLAHRDDQFDVVLRTVPQLLSVWDYDQLLNWCREHRVLIDSNAIYSPDYMHAGMLPDDIKQQIYQRLQPFLDPGTRDSVRRINLRDSHDLDCALAINADFVIQQLQQDYNTEERWPQFLNYCRKLDSVRGTSLHTYVPELSPTLKKHGY
jgi:sulfatase maturation enzyme AslB (radical SAM superfamily)